MEELSVNCWNLAKLLKECLLHGIPAAEDAQFLYFSLSVAVTGY